MCLIYPAYFPNISNYLVFVNHKNICFEIQVNEIIFPIIFSEYKEEEKNFYKGYI